MLAADRKERASLTADVSQPAGAGPDLLVTASSMELAKAGEGTPVVVAVVDDLRSIARLVAAGRTVAAPGRIGHTEGGRYLVEELRGQGAGRLHSLYLAVRSGHARADGNVFHALLWDAVCFVDDCLGEPLSDIHVDGGALFGPSTDTAVVIARSTSGTIVTAEISCCLPPEMSIGRPMEVEIEIMGETATLRATPYARCVSVRGEAGASDRFWGESPIPSMIAHWQGGCTRDEKDRLARRLATALSILDRVEAGGEDEGFRR